MNFMNKIWAKITKNWRVPFNPYAGNFGYMDKDGTFFAGYMTRGGEMRYEKKGVPAKYSEPEYVNICNTHTQNLKTGVVLLTSKEAIFREKNLANGKYRYFVGCAHNKRYIDAASYEGSNQTIIDYI